MPEPRPARPSRSAVAPLLLALLAGVLASGCTTTWRTYEGMERSAEEVARLRLPPDVVPGSVRLDDRPSPHRAVTRLELEPGPHRVSWRYRHHNRFEEEQSVSFVAAAGSELRLAQTFVRTPGPLGPITDLPALAVEVALLPVSWLLPPGDAPPPGRYHAWIEDPTGFVIAGDPPDLPTGFVEVQLVDVDLFDF